MRSNIHAPRLRALSKASALMVLAGIATACSNDVSRLDEMLTASVKTTDNQSAIINRTVAARQAFPGDVQSATNRSGIAVANRVMTRSAPLANAVTVAPKVNRASLPAVFAPLASQPVATARTAMERTAASAPAIKPIFHTPSAPKSPTASGPIVLQPRSTNGNALKIVGADNTVTGSVQQAVATKSATVKPQGWNNTKGAKVTVRPGETLHNLSRRYGVPVSDIMKANDIKDANSVAAGRTILIPTYNYSATAPVSAPDSDPTTKVSRSSRGFQGQPRGRVAVPTARAVKETAAAAPVNTASRTPILTSGSSYVVQSGDTLSGIARKTGSSVTAIRSANGLTNNIVRLGQSLTIPGAGYDNTVTGSVPPATKQSAGKKVLPAATAGAVTVAKRSQEQVSTPSKTNSTGFRWPASGRVISKFGERQPSGSNDGIDISVPIGTPIKASENGTVIYSGAELEDFGKLILVSHAGGWVSAYAHASTTLVRRGDTVRRGQVIAKSGKTGNATVPKLHFELRKNSNPVNPLKHLKR